MKKILFGVFIIPILLLSNEISLGIVPQQSPSKLSTTWLQITEYLSKETGIKVVFRTEKSIPTFEEKLYSGEYDVAYMNPYHFIIANNLQKYEAFLRDKNDIVGILVSKDNIIFDEKDLKNKTFLFPAPNAFAATLLIKYELKKKYNINLDTDAKVLYVNSHDSVYKGVFRDIGDFGGGINRTYTDFIKNSENEKMKIIYETDSYPSHPFAFHPRVDKKTVEKLEKAFLNMPENLKELLSIKEFKLTNSSEYDVIKDIGDSE